MIEKEKTRGCRKLIYDYSNQRKVGNNMEDIFCGDILDLDGAAIQELCPSCQKKQEEK